MVLFFFFFNDPATTEIYTLSLHDALPIYGSILLGDGAVLLPDGAVIAMPDSGAASAAGKDGDAANKKDRKSTRLNSSHLVNSYAVFCLKKKKYGVLHHPECQRYLG